MPGALLEHHVPKPCQTVQIKRVDVDPKSGREDYGQRRRQSASCADSVDDLGRLDVNPFRVGLDHNSRSREFKP